MTAPPSVFEVLRSHASCRDYLPEPIRDETVEDLVRTAQQAPTDATGQLYSILQVKDPRVHAELARLVGGQAHVASAPGLFIVLLDVRRLRRLLESRGQRYGMRPLVGLLFGITDASLFAQSFVLAAETMGYGTCYLGSVQNNSRAIARLLQLPAGVVPLYGITLGRPATVSPPKPRTPTNLVLHVDRYRDATNDELARTFEVMSKATRSGDWLNPIRKYFAAGGIMQAREVEFQGLLTDQGLLPDPESSR